MNSVVFVGLLLQLTLSTRAVPLADEYSYYLYCMTELNEKLLKTDWSQNW